MGLDLEIAAVDLVHHGQSQSEEGGRGLEVASVGSEHGRKDMEHVGAALDESEPGFHRPSAGLEATRADEDPIDEIGRLVAATGGQLEGLGAEPDGLVEPTLVVGQGGSCHLPAPRGQGVVTPVGVLLQSLDGIVECRPLSDLEEEIDAPAQRPGEVIVEVRLEAQAFDAIGDLQAACGVQRARRDAVCRVQGVDHGAHVARCLGGLQIPLGFRGFRWHSREIRRQHDHLAL